MNVRRFGTFAGPCDTDPRSQECEDFHCPRVGSGLPAPFGREDCRRYRRDKAAGMVTSRAELDRAAAINQDVAAALAERRRSAAEVAQVQAARTRAEEQLANQIAERAKLEAQLGTNKKIVIVGGIVLLAIGAGAFLFKGKRA